jgi:cell division protein FtsQ
MTKKRTTRQPAKRTQAQSQTSNAWTLQWPLLLSGFFLASMVGLFAWILVQMNGPVSVVQVQGDLSAHEQSEVSRVIGARLDQGILTVGLDTLVDEIMALAWPRSVEVRKLWPNRLLVRVEKETIAARWGTHAVLTTSGEIVPTTNAPEWLPRFDCANCDSVRAMQIYHRLRAILVRGGLDISSMRQDALGEWHIQLDIGLELAVGREDLAARTERFLAIYRSALADTLDRVERVDARYDNGVAVAWRDGRAPQGAQAQLANAVVVN